jgi:hypothetical protein
LNITATSFEGMERALRDLLNRALKDGHFIPSPIITAKPNGQGALHAAHLK